MTFLQLSIEASVGAAVLHLTGTKARCAPDTGKRRHGEGSRRTLSTGRNASDDGE